MSRRKVKRGRFLEKTAAEKQMESKLNQQISGLETALNEKITQRLEQEATERVGTAQGMLAADREAALAGKMGTGLAKNVALTAQLTSNAIADATTGRRVGTEQEVKGGLELAGQLSNIEKARTGFEVGETKQAAQIDLGKAIAEEKGDLAKRGAAQQVVLSTTKSALNEIANPDSKVQIDSNTGQLVLSSGGPFSNMNFTSQPGQSNMGDINYTPKDIKTIQTTPGAGLAFTR
jgi:hypothetical protein